MKHQTRPKCDEKDTATFHSDTDVEDVCSFSVGALTGVVPAIVCSQTNEVERHSLIILHQREPGVTPASLRVLPVSVQQVTHLASFPPCSDLTHYQNDSAVQFVAYPSDIRIFPDRLHNSLCSDGDNQT